MSCTEKTRDEYLHIGWEKQQLATSKMQVTMRTLQIPDCAYTHFIEHQEFITTLEQGNKSNLMQDVVNGWETFALADFVPRNF